VASLSTDPDILQLYNRAANTTRDRKHRSRTLEANQIRSVDNQIYGCPSSLTNQQVHHRSESHKHRGHRISSFRRSSVDTQDKQSQLRRRNEYTIDSANESWLDVGQEHWTNLLENGWRATSDTSGVNLVSLVDSGKENFCRNFSFY
jgi:hypothetical protein